MSPLKISRKRAISIFCDDLQEMANLERFLTGTCTMAIVMLVTFYPEELPGIPPSRVFSLMDVASYTDVWNAGRQVMDNCISRYLATNETMQEIGGEKNFRSQTGWSAIGTPHILKNQPDVC